MRRAKTVGMAVVGCMVGLCICTVGTISTPAVGTALTTSAVHFVNNEDSNIDFKLSDNDTEIVHKVVQNHTNVSSIDKDETDSLKNQSVQRDLSGYYGTVRDQYTKSAFTWLINNGVYARPHNVVFNNGYARAELLPRGTGGGSSDSNSLIDDSAWLSVNAHANKADFYMMLFKALGGVKSSKVCIYKGSAFRNGSSNASVSPVSSTDDYGSRASHSSIANYWGDYLSASFTGDYYAYVSPDVYELYFKELVDSGIIDLDSFSETSVAGKGFVNDYNHFSQADWSTNGEVFTPRSGSRALGYSVSISEESLNRVESPKYFKNNKIGIMDALTAIADLMHASEKELSKTEAKVIAYKYGLTYFSSLSEEERDTIYFLIAKGILNYDDSERMIGISGYLTRGQMYELLYRVANKDARYDFSKVQLTDSDSELADMGFSETKCDVIDAEVEPLRRRVSVIKTANGDAVNERRGIRGVVDGVIAALLHPVSVTAAKSQKSLASYEVTMQFDLELKESGEYRATGNSYQYVDGDLKIDLNESLVNGTLTGGVSDVVKKAEVIEASFNDKDTKVLQVTFLVNAASKSNACNSVDEHIVTKINNRTVSTINGITAVEDTATNASCTLLEQETITRVFSDITFLADKVLLNNKTGVRAIIDDKKGYALVGNTVLKSNNIFIMTSRSNVKKYYNVEILCGLMPSLSLKKTGFNNKGNNTIYNVATFNENAITNVVNSNDVKTQERAYYVNLNSKGKIKDSKIGKKTTAMYNTSSLCGGVSTLIRSFEINESGSSSSSSSLGEKVKVTLIVDFKFIVPPEELVTRSDEWFKMREVNDNSSLTLQDVIDFETQRPADGTVMADYWDSNLAYSNAIANFMYGTKKQEWITCGYIVPQVYACISGLDSSERSISSDFQGNGIGSGYSRAEKILENLFFNTSDVESFTYLNKYSKFLKNGTAAYWWISYVAGTGISCNGTDAPALRAFLSGARKFKVSYHARGIKAGEVFREDAENFSYVVTNNNVVYRNVALDERIVATVVDGKIQTVRVNTTTSGRGTSTTTRQTMPEEVGRNVVFKKSDGTKLNFKYSIAHSADGKIALIPSNGITTYLGSDGAYGQVARSLRVPCVLENGGTANAAVTVDKSVIAYGTLRESLLNAFSNLQNSIFRCNGDAPGSVSLSDVMSSTLTTGTGTFIGSNAFWNPTQFEYGHDVFKSIGFTGTQDVISVSKAVTDSYGYQGKQSTVRIEDGLYIMNGSGQQVLDKEQLGFRLSQGTNTFYAMVAPIFYFDENEWEFEGNTFKHTSSVEVLYDNLSVFTPSLNDSVITATLDSSLGTVDVEKLDPGTRLIIADTVWTKQTDGRWVSDPIKNRALVKKCKIGNGSKVRGALGLYFQSLKLRYNGRTYPFLNYVWSSEDDDAPSARIARYEGSDSTVWKRGVITLNDNDDVVVGYCRGKKNEIKYATLESGRSAQYVVIDIALKGSLKARPINVGRTVFTLCTEVGEGIVGSAAYSLIDSSELNFEIKDMLDVSVQNNQFAPSGFVNGIKADFTKAYYALLAKESIQFVFYVVTMLAAYLLVMSWLAFCVLTRGTGRMFFQKFAEATSKTGKGIDLFKIFTIGMYTLDRSPAGARCVIVSLVCCIVMAVCLVLM